jgi:PDZ domain-containing protein
MFRMLRNLLVSTTVVLLAPNCIAVIANDIARESDPTASAPENEPAPAPEQIAAWIVQLDDNRYVVREQATRYLLDAQAAALDPLLATANGESPEPADRAVWVLRRLGNSKEQDLRRQALERLAQLRNHPQAAVDALEALAQIRHNEAIVAIQRLGGRYVTGEQFGPYATPRVELDQQWRGGDAGLVHLRDLIGAYQVIIIGADITAKGAAELQHVNQLREVMLYRTQVTPEDVPALQKLLPHVMIDYRRGGLLGVGANPLDGTGAAVVATVQPGSAAEAAGILVGDTIEKFEGQKVENFRALTTMIGKHGAGDEVTIDVFRAGKPIHFKLKLGEWKSLQ